MSLDHKRRKCRILRDRIIDPKLNTRYPEWVLYGDFDTEDWEKSVELENKNSFYPGSKFDQPRFAFLLILVIVLLPPTILAQFISRTFNFMSQKYADWRWKVRLRRFPVRVLKAQGSLKGSGLPMICAKRYLLGNYFELLHGPRRPPRYHLDVNLKFYGELPIRAYIQRLFNLSEGSLVEALEACNLVGDQFSDHLDLIDSFKKALADKMLLRFAEGSKPMSYLTFSGSDGNITAIRLGRSYQHKKGRPFRKVLVSAEAHSGILGFLGSDAVIFPVNPHKGFQPDSEMLLSLLEEHPDCYIILLTAPTTNFNVVECVSKEVMRVIREKDIWVHVDGALSQLLGGLPTIQSGLQRKLISSDIVNSFSCNAHKLLGPPAIGVIYVLREEDQKVLGSELNGPGYITNGFAETLSTTSMDHGRHGVAYSRMEELGDAGCHFLLISAHAAALTLAQCLENRGVELFAKPQTQAVSIKIQSESERDRVQYQLVTSSPLILDVASVPLIEIDGEMYCGLRVVLTMGVHWDYETLDYLAGIISTAIRIAQGCDSGDGFIKSPPPDLSRKDELLEVPQPWLELFYDTFTPEVDGIRVRRELETPIFLQECRRIMDELAKEKPPSKNHMLSRRARAFGHGHRVLPASKLLALPG